MSAPDPTFSDDVPADVRERHARLSQDLDDYSYRYYLGSPIISDAEYDQLMAELRDLEAQYPSLVTLIRPPRRWARPSATSSLP